jgi:hypothetical protein
MFFRVFDNFISPTYANTIEADAIYHLQYMYIKKTSFTGGDYNAQVFMDNNTVDIGQMSCPVLHPTESIKFSYYFTFLKPFIFNIQDANPDLNLTGIHRLKFNILLQNSTAPENHYNIAHQDSVTPDSYSAVYYINDSDGDTFLFNEVVTDENILPERLTVAKRITPKKNRLLIFESNRYHASSNPRTSDSRFVINTIFVPVEKETK